MNALLATYLALSYIPNQGAAVLLPGYHHRPLPTTMAPVSESCDTAWGRRYALGEHIDLGVIQLSCEYVSTWHDGIYEGNSVRWTVSQQ